MGRINLNQLERAEELPNKIGSKRFIRLYDKKKNRNWWSSYYHGEDFYEVRKRIMRGSIGMKWDEVVEKIKERLPEGFAQEHPWIIERPDVMMQSIETGKWYFVDSDGRFEGRWTKTKYHADTPKELKKQVHWDTYYLNKEGILKWVKGNKKKKQRPNSKPLNQVKEERKKSQLAQYLTSIADYSKIAKKQQTWKSGGWDMVMENIKSISFDHPTKKQERKRYDKETNSWIGMGIYDPIKVTLTIPQFKYWCEKNSKTYFIFDGENYHTNLKWSFKQ